MKILLMGNSNVGKSVIFSRLTGVQVTSSNYAGTTVGYTKGRLKFGEMEAELVDVPGTYSLQPACQAEEVARQMFQEEDPDLVFSVMDATNLERNFFLTLQLLESGKPMVVVLNMWDCAQSKGVYLDLPSLSQALGVPVVTLTAVSGEGLKELVGVMGDSLKKTDQYQSKLSKMNDEERWAIIGQVIPRVQKIEHRHPTLLQRLERASVHPSTDF